MKFLQSLRALSLSTKITAICAIIIFLTAFTVTVVAYREVEQSVADQVQSRQSMSLAVAAQVIGDAYPSLDVTWGRNNVPRVTSNEIETFTNHAVIDQIGTITSETATIFVWDEKTKDFWRRTTNIKKPDGTRAIGTPLGKTGRVYPVVTKGQTFRGEATILGKDYYTIYEPIRTTTGKVIGILYVGVAKERLNSVLGSLQRKLVIAALLTVLFFGGMMAWISRRMVRALPRLATAIETLARDECSKPIPDQDRLDEIGTVAKALSVLRSGVQERLALTSKQEEMAEKQAAMEAEQKAREEEARAKAQQEREEAARQAQDMIATTIENAATTLETNMTRVLEDINSAITVFESEVTSLSGAAEQTDLQSQTITTSATEARASVGTMAAATEELASSVREITNQIARTSEQSQMSVSAAKETNKQVTALEQATGDIQGFVGLIRDIAEQTNLLALNATIEAARAGEAGKGFSVVASEVKALANQTAKATEQVSEMINRMLGSVSSAMASLEQTSNSIYANDEIIASIADAVTQQDAATTEIAVTAQAASESTSNSASECSKIADVAKQTRSASEKIGATCQNLAAGAKALDEELKTSLIALRNVVNS